MCRRPDGLNSVTDVYSCRAGLNPNRHSLIVPRKFDFDLRLALCPEYYIKNVRLFCVNVARLLRNITSPFPKITNDSSMSTVDVNVFCSSFYGSVCQSTRRLNFLFTDVCSCRVSMYDWRYVQNVPSKTWGICL